MLLIYDESIGDGSFLLVRSVGVGSEFRLQGGVFGFAAHLAVDDVGAFGGDFGTYHFAFAVDPNVDYNVTFLIEIFVGTFQFLGTTAT